MFEQVFRNVDDVLRREAGCTTEPDYTDQASWILFLKYPDALVENSSKTTWRRKDESGTLVHVRWEALSETWLDQQSL